MVNHVNWLIVSVVNSKSEIDLSLIVDDQSSIIFSYSNLNKTNLQCHFDSDEVGKHRLYIYMDLC